MSAPPLAGMFRAPMTFTLKAVLATDPMVARPIVHQRSRSVASEFQVGRARIVAKGTRTRDWTQADACADFVKTGQDGRRARGAFGRLEMQLRGAVAVVTGASSGFGELIGLALAREGSSVVLAARRM